MATLLALQVLERVRRDPGELLTMPEVAAVMRVDPKTVTRWCAGKKMNSIRTPGRQYRVRGTELLRVLEEGIEP